MSEIDKIDNPELIKKTFGLSEVEDITIQQILNNLLDGQKNLNLKTQVDNPHNLSALFLTAEVLESLDKEFEECANIIKNYIKIRNEYMVSKGREGRREIIKAISSFKKEVDGSESKISTKLD